MCDVESSSALEDDADWLQERGYRFDVEEFCFWVSREMEEGWTEEEARERVAKFMRGGE
jgi:hypothetical protein